jgi:hypothetical protein
VDTGKTGQSFLDSMTDETIPKETVDRKDPETEGGLGKGGMSTLS